jgi:hypothetical protein
MVFDFFYIQGLRIFASTLSDFCRSIREVWTNDGSFPCLWFSSSLYISGIAYCIATSAIHFLPNPCHSVELWTFQMWLKGTSWIIRESAKVEMWISRFLRWKSKLCSMGTIYDIGLFVVHITSFHFLSPFTSKDDIFFQASYQIFVVWPARLGEKISFCFL